MIYYIIRRLVWLVLVLLVITAITYLIYFVLPTTDPALLFAGKEPTPQLLAQVSHNLGLDKPAWEQYVLFVRHLFFGDQYGWPGLGYSFVTHTSIKSEMGGRLVITVTLAVGAAIVWLVMGISIGIISAVMRGTIVDRLALGFALFFVSAPVFWLGLVFLWLFWFKFGVAAGTGYYPPSQYGIFTWLNHMIMPWVVLALLYAAWYARMIRGSLLETFREDFIRTARAKGLSERRILFRHALRASLTPTITMFGMDIAGLVGGTVIVETVFNMQGVGQWAVESVFTGDLPAILAVTLLAAFAITFANLIVDIVYVYMDPRIRTSVNRA